MSWTQIHDWCSLNLPRHLCLYVCVCVSLCSCSVWILKNIAPMLDWHASSEHLGQHEIVERRKKKEHEVTFWSRRESESKTLKAKKKKKEEEMKLHRSKEGKRQGTKMKRGRLWGWIYFSYFNISLPVQLQEWLEPNSGVKLLGQYSLLKAHRGPKVIQYSGNETWH